MSVTITDRPVGTLEELQEQGLDPMKYGSCSKRDVRNKGCAWHQFCRFREYRDRVAGKQGPANTAIRIILAPVDGGAADNKVMPCFDYYYSGLYTRQKQSAETGEIVKIIAMEGDGKKVRCRTTEREHPKPVPGCIACSEGKCVKRVDVVREEVVPLFPRPAEAFAAQGEAARQREEMMLEDDAATTSAALAKQTEMIGGIRKPTAGPAR